MSVNAVLFDLDGTLVNSLPDLTSGLNEYLSKKGLLPFSQNEVASFIGKGARTLLERALQAQNIHFSSVDIDHELALYEEVMRRKGTPTTNFFPGVTHALQLLHDRAIKVGLVTNKMRSMTVSFLKEKNAARFFDVVVTGSDGLPPKPAADMLQFACRSLQRKPQQCVMVGDSCNDAWAARAADMPVWLVQTGYNEGEPIAQWARLNGFDQIAADVPAVVSELLNKPA